LFDCATLMKSLLMPLTIFWLALALPAVVLLALWLMR
jgi:hypothetical protein